MSQHSSLVMIANVALGGSPTPAKKDVVDVTEGALSYDHALAAMNSMLNWG